MIFWPWAATACLIDEFISDEDDLGEYDLDNLSDLSDVSDSILEAIGN